jgi:hypothetical protein
VNVSVGLEKGGIIVGSGCVTAVQKAQTLAAWLQ